jgi:hypothetical protein
MSLAGDSTRVNLKEADRPSELLERAIALF